MKRSTKVQKNSPDFWPSNHIHLLFNRFPVVALNGGGVWYFYKYQSVKPPTTLLCTRGKFQYFHFYAVYCKNIHSIFVQIFLVDLAVAVATVANHPCKWLGLLGADVVTACTNCTCCTFTAQMGTIPQANQTRSKRLKMAQNGCKK